MLEYRQIYRHSVDVAGKQEKRNGIQSVDGDLPDIRQKSLEDRKKQIAFTVMWWWSTRYSEEVAGRQKKRDGVYRDAGVAAR